MDWKVKRSSRISKLPAIARAPALTLRNVYLWHINARARANYHSQDGIRTIHNIGFMQEPLFKRVYETAVATAGNDYGIPYRIHQALWCSHQAQKIAGDLVELGTGRGFVMSAVLDGFRNWAESERNLYLLDTFRPYSLDKHGEQSDSNEVRNNYAVSAEDTRERFAKWPKVHIVPGNVFSTVPKLQAEKVAYLHIDLNFHKPEVWALEFLWDRIPRGGVVLLDDYASQGATRQFSAMNDLAYKLGVTILSTPTGQGLIVK